MSCWLCESSDEPIVSNKTPIKDMLTLLYPKMMPRMPKALDLCSGCFLELNTYYNFKLSYNMELKAETSEDEEDFVDLTEDQDKRTCSVCSKSVQQDDICFVKECANDDEESAVLSADLIRTYFPQIKLDTPDNMLACSRCSDLLRGMHDYHEKCNDKTVITSLVEDDVKKDHETYEENQDRSHNISRTLATIASGAQLYNTNAFAASMLNDSSSDSNMPFEYDDESVGNHFMFQNETQKGDGEVKADQPPKSVSQQIELAQISCNMFISTKTSKGRLFQCERCQYSSNRKDNMRRHIFIRHIKRKMMRKCPHCPLQTVSAEILSNHIEQRHKNVASNRVFACSVCDFKAKTYSHLQNHIKSAHSEHKATADVFACNMCDFMTSREQYLQKHIRYKHSNFMVYLDCRLCNYQTRRKDNLKQHMDHMHGGEFPGPEYYKCHICGFRCTRKDKLKRHMDCIHVEDDKKPCFKCGACDYTCTRKDTLKRHVEYQHSKKGIVFRCNMCPYSADIYDYLQKHIKYAHTQQEKVYQCHVCSYSTFKKILFGQHYRRRHGTAPPLELEDRCECYFKAGGYNSSCIKCRSKAEETEVICLDDDSEMCEEEEEAGNS